MKLPLVVLVSIASTTNAKLGYFGTPQSKYDPLSVPSVGPGCGAFVTPDDQMLIVTSSNSQVSAFDVKSGNPIFSYNPSDEDRNGNPTFCTSGVAFGALNASNYFVTGISYGFQNTAKTYCQIVALRPDGSQFWKSDVFDGACSGTPVIGEEGRRVYFTRNTATNGSFTVLSADLNGTVYYNNYTQPRPFAPPGIFRHPAEGYYQGGAGNMNDLVIFGSTAFYGESSVGFGSLYAFQNPLAGAQSSVTLINNASSWYTFSAPKITNYGYNMYMTVSRNQFRAWIGGAGDKNNQFNRFSTTTVAFPRGSPAWVAPAASVALSSNPTEPMVFGGDAGKLMIGYTFDMKEMWKVTTNSTIYAEAKVSPQDDRVYWVEENGMVHASNVTTGKDFWSMKLANAPVRSSFAQTSDGSTLFFTDVAGDVFAFDVAVSPSSAPSITTASSKPSGVPSVILSKSPSISPSNDIASIVPTATSTSGISLAMPTSSSFAPSTTPLPSLFATLDPTVATPIPTFAPTTSDRSAAPLLQSFSPTKSSSDATCVTISSVALLAAALLV